MKLSDCWYSEVCDDIHTDCLENCRQYREMKFLMTHSNLPANRQVIQTLVAPKVDLEAYRRLAEIKSDIVGFVKDGNNLYICSNTPGNGKTTWAIKLLHSYFNRMLTHNNVREPRERGMFIPVAWFLLKCKDFKRVDNSFEDIKELLLKVDLVIWDDIGSMSISDYDYTNLLMYIDARRNAGLSNIFTGNITNREDFVSVFGAKLADRIWSNSTEVIEFKSSESLR